MHNNMYMTHNHTLILHDVLRDPLIKNTGLFGNFSHIGGGGLPNSQNFGKLTKYFFVHQIHSEVLKHVLQRGGVVISDQFDHLLKFL